ncbi:MAG TPA: potassium channel family protein [Burkholderiaceae bacterium]|nr:potassium channel family protein [Burkholderiaceae bacterium]
MSLERLRAHRYLILLLMLVTAIVLGMTFSPHAYLREAVVTILMVMVFFIVFERHSHRLLSLCAGLVVVVALWALRLLPVQQRHVLEIAVHLSGALFLALAVSVILRHLFERRAVNIDDLLGTLCGYLLAAMAFANVFAFIELTAPGAFNIVGPLSPALGQWHERESLFLYFSLTTLTTIGYGDVSPVAAAARSAAALEGVFGQFYIAVVVAQLVGSKLAEANSRGRSDRR